MHAVWISSDCFVTFFHKLNLAFLGIYIVGALCAQFLLQIQNKFTQMLLIKPSFVKLFKQLCPDELNDHQSYKYKLEEGQSMVVHRKYLRLV